MAIQIQLRRDTAANWTSGDPTLASGEAGVETDTLKFKIGDGSTAWIALAYAGGSGANHAILDGSVHSDSVADGVTRGSIIYGNATPKWDELVVGGADTFLGSDGTDLSYRTAAQVMASLSAEGGAAFDLNGQDLINGGVLFLTEQAAAEADVAGKGQIWIKTATPNTAWFTDDAGTDVQLGISGSAFSSRIHVYRNANQVITTATNTKVEFNTETYDNANEYDIDTNHRMTIDTTGYYNICAGVTIDGMIDASRIQTYCVKNGATYYGLSTQHGSHTQDLLATGGIDLYLVATDYIEIFVYQDTGGDKNVVAGGGFEGTFFTVHRFA